MLIKDVERYTIPLGSFHPEVRAELGLPLGGTTVAELIQALRKLPEDAVVTNDFGGSNIFVTHYKPDIDSSVEIDPALEALQKALF
ncbi:hypothetical protein KIY87_gp55 [Mycobacterium phage Malec]|uniref:Uncharacterized protein n=2 Tax=Turbidovirus TaxID=2948936 RepID=A0A0A0RN38_9CAUD|nr:hypothetical protein PBI_LARENN_45 [Mycobacterium phage Larenn]YP_010064137.1 hypothetical protein KIY87_gp55 [Mycobacterium phage Malec]AIW02940.1 hypothetical protein PBI_LARENN_45 [Mycobacterium phage Larenn]AZV00840.1 hypothetical protein SEA_MALEC_46 [Mycobacterium phage Malec]